MRSKSNKVEKLSGLCSPERWKGLDDRAGGMFGNITALRYNCESFWFENAGAEYKTLWNTNDST